MDNKEAIEYIDKNLKLSFKGIYLEEGRYLDEPNGNLFLKYQWKDYQIMFVKDRSYLEVELLKNDNYIKLHEVNPSFLDIKVNNENIENAIVFLDKYLNAGTI